MRIPFLIPHPARLLPTAFAHVCIRQTTFPSFPKKLSAFIVLSLCVALLCTAALCGVCCIPLPGFQYIMFQLIFACAHHCCMLRVIYSSDPDPHLTSLSDSDFLLTSPPPPPSPPILRQRKAERHAIPESHFLPTLHRTVACLVPTLHYGIKLCLSPPYSNFFALFKARMALYTVSS